MGNCQSYCGWRCKCPSRTPPLIIVNEVCKRKAAYVAHQSAWNSSQTRGGMATVIAFLAAFMFALAMCSDFDVSSTMKRRVRYLATATVLLICIAACLTTYVFAVQHEFYCEAHPTWHRWNSEWALAACEPGVISLLALSDWMFFLTNAVMGMLRDKPSMQIPWSLCLLAMPLVIGHVVQDMLRSMRTRDRHTRNHVGHKMNTLFSCLKRSGKRSKRSNRPSADVELAAAQHSEMQEIPVADDDTFARTSSEHADREQDFSVPGAPPPYSPYPTTA